METGTPGLLTPGGKHAYASQGGSVYFTFLCFPGADGSEFPVASDRSSIKWL